MVKQNILERNKLKYAESLFLDKVFGIWGKNFPNTILSLSKSKEKIDVVSDQIGSPTSTLMIVDIIQKIISCPNLSKIMEYII